MKKLARNEDFTLLTNDEIIAFIYFFIDTAHHLQCNCIMLLRSSNGDSCVEQFLYIMVHEVTVAVPVNNSSDSIALP
jgi:hypothetical protein